MTAIPPSAIPHFRLADLPTVFRGSGKVYAGTRRPDGAVEFAEVTAPSVPSSPEAPAS